MGETPRFSTELEWRRRSCTTSRTTGTCGTTGVQERLRRSSSDAFVIHVGQISRYDMSSLCY
jgi:hypothetical protein